MHTMLRVQRPVVKVKFPPFGSVEQLDITDILKWNMWNCCNYAKKASSSETTLNNNLFSLFFPPRWLFSWGSFVLFVPTLKWELNNSLGVNTHHNLFLFYFSIDVVLCRFCFYEILPCLSSMSHPRPRWWWCCSTLGRREMFVCLPKLLSLSIKLCKKKQDYTMWCA